MKIRNIEEQDLQARVDWMNDSRVNATLNIQLPVTIESTVNWYHRIQGNKTRRDFSFEKDGQLVAMGGFTDIDDKARKAELYIFVNPVLQGKGLSMESVRVMCQYGFEQMGLQKICLYTNSDDLAARHIYEKIGFVLEGFMRKEIINNGKIKDRCYYGLYNEKVKDKILPPLLITFVNILKNNRIQRESFFLCQDFQVDNRTIKVVRDDIFPFIGGGSKARKAIAYEQYLKEHEYNAVVTTGGIQSNHNRAIALMAARNGWKCHLVYHGTEERFNSEKGNALLVRLTGASVEFVEASGISKAMNDAMERFTRQKCKPFYVTGGGHDLPGGIAFIDAVKELYQYGVVNNYKPDYIFHASGTGSTQAGIMVGLDLVGWSDVKVVGISVARQEERGKQIIAEFANRLGSYYGLGKDYTNEVLFNTDYLYGGYECYTHEMKDYLQKVMLHTGLIFDMTYSGKGFYGMMDVIKHHGLEGNILFWHTGGLMNMQK